jgi:hypothetical protein
MAQLFGDERCTAAILGFLETTEVCRHAGAAQERGLGGWGEVSSGRIESQFECIQD